MPSPTPDPSTGWWSIRIKLADGTRKKFTLAKQPGWKKPGDKMPKKPPPEVEMLARRYQDMAIMAKHGVDVSSVRATDLAAYLQTYADAYALNRAANSARILRQTLAHFLAYCERKGIKTVQAVTTVVCEDYMAYRRRQGAARSTVKLERGILSPIWSKAVRNRVAPENPWKLVDVPGKDDSAPPEYWTLDELKRLIEGCRQPWLRDLVIVTAGIGARISSVLNLRWPNVLFDRGVVRLHSKTGVYEVPLSPDVRAVLERRKREVRGPLVFPGKRTKKAMTPAIAYVAIRSTVRRLGLPEKGDYNHILRHTFASHHVMRGVPLVIVSKWLGHSNITMTMRYSHLCQVESQRHMESYSLGLNLDDTPPPSALPPPA